MRGSYLRPSPDSICLVNRDWTINYLNERALTDVKSSHDAVGCNLWERFPHLLGTDFEKAYRRAMDERVSTSAEGYYEPVDAWFRAYAHPLPEGLVISFRDVTVKRWRQTALQESEERYHNLFKSLTQGVMVHDSTGAVVNANLAAERIVGLSLEQMRNLHKDDSRQPVDEQGAPMPREKRPSIVALTTGRPVENCIMGVINPRLGERRWLNVHAIPILRENETKPSQVYALFADVTARKQTEIALSASEARLNRITRNLPIAVFERLLTAEGKVSYPYYNARELVRPTDGDLDPRDGGSLWAQVHPEDRKPFAAQLRASAENLSVLSQEFRLVGEDGTVRWMHSKGVPRRTDRGDTLWEGFAIDVTEQNKTEEALRASEAKLRRSQEHFARAQRVAGVGSTEIDFRTGEWIWSDELYRIYGLDMDGFHPCEAALFEALHPDDRDRFRADFEGGLRGEEVRPLEFRIVRPDGEIRTIYREVEILRDEVGQAIGLVATQQDITQLRRMEREGEQLRQDLMRVQRLDALGRLAGGIAHDVNNTLVPVIGLTETMLKSLQPGSPDAEALAIVRDAGIRAKGLVQRILTFSRRDPPNRERIDLGRFLCETMRFIRAMVPTTIEIETHLHPVPAILADTAQLHQLMINLVTNSVDAIGAAKGTIAVRLSPGGTGTLAAEGYIWLSVTDTGVGMDKATLENIYEPFFTTKGVDEGTGLGLSVVYGMVCAHGGQIDVTSAPGNGTRFDIFLPIDPPNSRKGN
jgi:PAS domain S-box-containing protein